MFLMCVFLLQKTENTLMGVLFCFERSRKMLIKEEPDDYINRLVSYWNIPKLHKGEHFISYLLALVESNDVDCRSIAIFFEQVGYFSHQVTFHPERLNDPIDHFITVIDNNQTPLEIYLKSTEMKFVHLYESDSNIDYFWLRHYQPIMKTTSIYREDLIFNMCETCMNEDRKNIGRKIIYVGHQLPFVKVCPKHKMKLHKYYIERNRFDRASFKRYGVDEEVEVTDFDYRFAKFMNDLSSQKMEYSLKDIVSDINSKVSSKPVGYYLRDAADERLVCLYNKYVFQRGFELKEDNLEDMFQLMYFIYHDAQNVKIIPKNEHLKEFKKAISDKYDLIGDYRESVVEVKCMNCNKIFITTPRLILYGHECPYCKATTKKYYINLVQQFCEKEYEGKYRLKQYDHEKHKVILYDRRKEKTVEINSFRFLSKCLRKQKRSKHRGIDFWDPYSDYGTFDQYYKGEYFISEISREYFLRVMFDLVGDEYQLVGNYINMFTEVELRHTLCGKMFVVRPYDFLNGKRCGNCKVKYTGEEIANLLNNIFSGFTFISNYNHATDSYLFRVLKFDYYYNFSFVERVYQLSEDILLQELLRSYHSDIIFSNLLVSRNKLYDFFYQKDINCFSVEEDKGDE